MGSLLVFGIEMVEDEQNEYICTVSLVSIVSIVSMYLNSSSFMMSTKSVQSHVVIDDGRAQRFRLRLGPTCRP